MSKFASKNLANNFHFLANKFLNKKLNNNKATR